MVIVDTSIWVDFMRAEENQLSAWISQDLVLQHPFVTAEVGMGSFRTQGDRFRTIDLLESFQQLEIADSQTFHGFVSQHEIYGTGLGFADAHLLLACSLQTGSQLATRDKRLATQASRLGIQLA